MIGKRLHKTKRNKHEILISPAGEREREKIKNLKKIKIKKKQIKNPKLSKGTGKKLKKKK